VTVKAGQTINLTLFWQAGIGAGDGRAYTVFSHLLGADLRIYGQHDSQPAEETRPTTGWMAGEIVSDQHHLAVQPETPAGDYVVEIGLYDPATDRRLEAVSEDSTRSDHVILTTRVRVER
jgi:hypothetical protein